MRTWLTNVIAAAERLRRRLGNRAWRYWLTALGVLVVSVYVAPQIDDYLNLVRARYWLFQRLGEITPRSLEPRFVKVVLVDDDEYWRGVLQGRRPIKRDYLARMTNALDGANASVIALDFDVRLPDSNSLGTAGNYAEIPADYRSETDVLMRALGSVADRRKIVLPRTIAYGEGGGYELRPDIYQPYGICSSLNADGQWSNPGTAEFPLSARAQRNISCGYIALPYDMRLLPPRLVLASGLPIDSFAMAVARAVNPQNVAILGTGMFYGSYIPPAVIERFHATSSAGDVLRGVADATESLNAKAVIVGGHWHVAQYGVGDIVDTHVTPIGPTSGALIHENFAEAILDSRTYGYTPEWILQALEIVFSIAAAVMFAFYHNVWVKVLTFLGFAGAMVIVQWIMLQVLGTFFEAMVPLFGLLVHSVIERLLD